MMFDREIFPIYFNKPEYNPELSAQVNLMIAMGAKSSRLALEERTRVEHIDGRPENVAEHAHMAAKTAIYLAKEFYPHLDAGKVAIKLIIHDDPEAYVKDTATDRITDEEREAKERREAFGLSVLVDEYASISPNYVDDMVKYEDQESLEDEFAGIIDKMTPLLNQVANGGKTARDNYTKEEFLELTFDTEKRLKIRYPHFPELAELRTELALYIHDTFM